MKASDSNGHETRFLNPAEEGIAGIPSVSYGSYRANWQALPEHRHAHSIELCLCARGALEYECEGVSVKLLPNNMLLTRPGDRHHLVTSFKGMRIYWMTIDLPKRGAAILGLPHAESDVLVARLKSIESHVFAVPREMSQAFQQLFALDAKLKRGAYRTLSLRTLCQRILLLVSESAENRPTLKKLAKISDIARIISARPAHRFTTAELAAHAGMSAGRFTALFRNVIGMPPYAYLAKCRLEEVQRLLTKTDRPIADIARELGYSSPQHLATQFRKTYGITATACRRNQKR